jgi:tetratricopeptide (TPR) repeat protein
MDFQHAYDLHILALNTPDKHFLLHQAKDAYMALEPSEKVYTNLASLLVTLENYIAAQEIYDIMVKEYPSDITFLNYGNLCYKLKDYKKSEELFLQAIELGSKKALNNYAWQLHGQLHFHNALFYYRLALKGEITDSMRANVLSNIGLLYHERFLTQHYPSQYHEAEANYLQCLELLPDQPDVNELLPILRSGSIIDFWIARDKRFS